MLKKGRLILLIGGEGRPGICGESRKPVWRKVRKSGREMRK